MKLGILGGTFDPIHFGHLAIAEEVAEALSLDRVLFVPARQPPHKMGIDISPAEDRAAMVELAIADNPAFALSRVELDREGPSYTVETLEILARPYPGTAGPAPKPEFFFILSAEAVAFLPTWREPARILELARLVVVPRPGYPMPDLGQLAARFGRAADRILTVDTSPLAHSASDIRRRAATGRSIRYLVPAAVEAYVADHGLYRSDEPQKEESK